MNVNSYQHDATDERNEHLARTLYTRGRYFPLLLAVSGLGFAAIYLLTRLGILGEPTPQLLYVSVATFSLALAEMGVLKLAKKGKGIAASVAESALAGIFAVLLTLFWQGMAPLAFLIAIMPPLAAIRNDLPRKHLSIVIALSLTALLGILWLNASPPFERMKNETPAAVASIIFFFATGLLLATITLISQNKSFRSLQNRLLTAFVIIITISTVMTGILSAIGAYTNNQTETFKSLEAITTLKLNQIETLLADSQNDVTTLLADATFLSNTLELLADNAPDADNRSAVVQEARSRMVAILGAEEEAYDEMMVLDSDGNVILSTIQETEGVAFSEQQFFDRGRSVFYAEFAELLPGKGESLFIATPIVNPETQVTLGVLVLRSNSTGLHAIMESNPGFSEMETYLVDTGLRPVTNTRFASDLVETQAAIAATRRRTSGSGIMYPNYAGQQVLGYYRWFAPMQVAVIAEIPLSFVVRSSLQSLAGSAILTLIVVAVAIAAVIISARTITDPISRLAETTQSFAAGKFYSRAVVDGEDEIGALARAYNQMAEQLQEMIGKLEQRVADRTRDLEGQSSRLRVAAEIARDAASARNLRELLDRTAESIGTRFSLFHTGIFLLDSSNQFAVLVASPTEAGKRLIANNHRQRVGDPGNVGRVSATGEPRVVLNTGSDSVPLANLDLPRTRSQMSLPLRVENRVIGVLDVHSDEPQAFNHDDVATMQILADQLATAIERARLLEEVELNLKELESAYGRSTSQNWNRAATDILTGNRGYRFDNIRVEPVSELPELAYAAMKTGKITNSNGSTPGSSAEHKVAVPIKLRGQTIGVISLKLKEGYDSRTISIIELATERLAAAMESARLYEEMRLRADREQSIARVTTAISSSTEYDQILQTTVREIGNILGDTEVAIQILDEASAEKRMKPRDS
jgi:GAF domain-containing protein/HAMP domain-containing protein